MPPFSLTVLGHAADEGVRRTNDSTYQRGGGAAGRGRKKRLIVVVATKACGESRLIIIIISHAATLACTIEISIDDGHFFKGERSTDAGQDKDGKWMNHIKPTDDARERQIHVEKTDKANDESLEIRTLIHYNTFNNKLRVSQYSSCKRPCI